MNVYYTKPIFTPICKNGSLKYGGKVTTMVTYGKLTLETTVHGKNQQEAEIKLLKMLGSDAVIKEEEK